MNSSPEVQTSVSNEHDRLAPSSADHPNYNDRISVLERENEALRQTLFQTETLMRETNHRVKNNLQMVSSLLLMQAELLRDHNAVAALRASQHRVLSMAMIHERLCGDPGIDLINFEEYTRALIKELFDSYGMQGGRVTSRLDCSQIFLKVEQAIPCSLILNELVTNALKYAYPNDATGQVKIGLHQASDGIVTLLVSDDGVGLPEGCERKDSSSMGLTIVDLLVKQIGGKLNVTTRPGTEFRIQFHQ